MIKFKKSEWERFKGYTGDALDRLVEIRKEYRGRSGKAGEVKEIELSRKYENEIDSLIERAQLRTLADMSSDEIAFDAFKMIMFQAYRDRIQADTIGTPDPFGRYDLRIDEHLIELRNRGNRDLCEWIEHVFDRYMTLDISKKESEYFKNYEPFVVEE